MSLKRLRASLDACYRWLDKPRSARRVVFLLLAIHSGLLAYSAYVHSPNLNEPAHLLAGISHWKFGQFELYRVNPPLVRMIAALPVMAVGSPASANVPHERWCDSPAANLRWESTLARDEFILLFPAIVIVTVVSFKSGFSEHMRYVLPAFPYFFIAGREKVTVTKFAYFE